MYFHQLCRERLIGTFVFCFALALLEILSSSQVIRGLATKFPSQENHLFGSTREGSYPSSSSDSIVKANNTAVTAFYHLGTNRHTKEEYDELLSKTLSITDPLIIFTSPDLAPKLAALRGKPKSSLVVPLELNKVKVATMFSVDTWKQEVVSHGGAQGVSSHEVFWVWHAKIELLKIASEINPFGSEFFAWIDAGMIRWDEYGNTTFSSEYHLSSQTTKCYY